MAGGDSGTNSGWRWDVVLSFAGAQRDYVSQVATALKARGVRCFYDADEEIDLWGKYLAEELPAIYAERAAAAVVFISAEYAARDWTRLERRAALARAVRERREYVLPARFDDTPLPGLLTEIGTISLRIRSPQQCAAMIAAKLAALGITASLQAGSSAQDAAMVRPTGAVRVDDADLRRLGVHAAISVDGVSDSVPPEYVPRDVDHAGHGVRAKVAAAAERGGFVLLVGGSSVGKTRCAAEAARALLSDWWLVHPADPAEIGALLATPPRRLVVWLDELQRYLDGEHGLTGGMMRALLNAPDPVVIIGTLWPERYNGYVSLPPPGGTDFHVREREVIDLAEVIHVGPELSSAEQERARAAAACDPRVRAALETTGYGLTQTLAAAPQLVARWQDARTAAPYAWALLTAALDAVRLGVRGPLGESLLRSAAVGYCTSAQQAQAPGDWFEQALAYAASELHGAVSALSPAGAGMGQIAGYTVADYLVQHASRERRYTRVPASMWDAVLQYVREPADSARLADSARNRMLYRYAISLYRRSADDDAARQLAGLLAGRGDFDGAGQILASGADAGDKRAAWQLAKLLAERGDLDGLRVRADASDEEAAWRLAGLLIERGDLDGLRARANAGDGLAAWRLAELLIERGDLDEAIQILRARAEAGDSAAASRLASLRTEHKDLNGPQARADAGDGADAGLLVERGNLDGLRARADAGDGTAARRLARLLIAHGDLDEAARILQAPADAGDGSAAWRLATLLSARGDLDALRARADAGDGAASVQLARLMAEHGDLDGLRARADAGDEEAASWLAELLAERGDLDGLHARINAGDEAAASRLAEALIRRGHHEEADRLRRFGLNPDGSIAHA